MSFVTVRHFWNWFKVHNQTFLSLPNASKQKQAYWENEFNIHMAPYFGPELRLDIIYQEGRKSATAVITAFGQEEFFAKADKIAEEAPFIKGWTFQALYPPMEADFMIRERHDLKGFDPFSLQFCPFNTIYEQPKCDLVLFADNDKPVLDEHMAAVWDVVYNLLGERITALNIGDITIFPIDDAPEEIKIALLPIADLPDWFDDNSPGGFIVDEQGIITPR